MNQKDLEKAKEYERQILRTQGFADSEFEVAECGLANAEFIHYVRIQKTPATRDNVLLMAHGYMGSNIGFFKMYSALKEHFHIVSIDIPGQGLSSSRKETPESIEGWLDYFVSSIKHFCDKMGLSRFSVCGHSMGAYVLTHFTRAHPQMVKDSFLLSPGGVNLENPDFLKKREDFIKSRNALFRCIGRKISNKIFIQKYAPFNIWFFSLFRSRFAKMIYGGKRLRLNQEEQKYFVPLYKLIYNSKPSSDKCLGYLFNEGPMSDRPLMHIFEKYQEERNVYILFGKFDWMDYPRTTREIDEKQLSVDVDFVDNCDHQIVFQNPEGAGRMIISKKREWDLLEENSRKNEVTEKFENDMEEAKI